METKFWILALVIIIWSAILLAIDYNNSLKDKKSKTALLWGAAIVAAIGLLAAWGYSSIHSVIKDCAAMLALIYFGRYLARKIASRKE